jgi:histidine triad (HIT) family protein
VDRAIPSAIVYEDDLALAFEDINPQAPVHTLVIPKRHVGSLDALQTEDSSLLSHLMLTCTKIARQKDISRSGYRLVANTGAHGGQTVFHLHVHVLGGRPMKWPPG